MVNQIFQNSVVLIVEFALIILVFLNKSRIFKKFKRINNSYKIKKTKTVIFATDLYLVLLSINAIILFVTLPFVYSIIFLTLFGFIGPIFEELVFRGLFIGYISEKLNLKRLKLICMIIFVNFFFAIIHNAGSSNPKNFFELIITFLLGIIVSVVYLKKDKSILYPILIHLLFNSIRMLIILLTISL